MKILTFREFCALPEGAIYSYYEPAICRGLYRKGETLLIDGEPTDFFETSLVPMCWNGEESPVLENALSRWGEYDYDQLFAVLEDADLKTLRDILGIQ